MDYSVTNHLPERVSFVDGSVAFKGKPSISSICISFEPGETLDKFNEKEIGKILKSIIKLSKHNNAKYAASLQKVPWAKPNNS